MFYYRSGTGKKLSGMWSMYNFDHVLRIGLKNFPIYFYTDNTKTETFYGGIFGVNPAVDEFVEQYNYDLNLTDEFTATWWIIKNDMNTF